MKSKDPKTDYSDIIELPYCKNPYRRHMSLYERAAQFAPFAALSGYEEMILEESRLAETESELSDYKTLILDEKLSIINYLLENGNIPEVTLIFFVPDKNKTGGSYKEITALVKSIDVTLRKMILYGSYDIHDRRTDNITIDFDSIKDIKNFDKDEI